jgi:hypothetical protein
VALTGDGRLVTGSDDTTARLWALHSSGQALIAEAKNRAPRCLTPAQRQLFYLAPAPPRWCATKEKWPFDAVGALVEAGSLLAQNKDDEAAIITEARLQHDPGAKTQFDAEWADAYIARGKKLLDADKEVEAAAVFELALKRDRTAGPRIDAVRSEVARAKNGTASK